MAQQGAKLRGLQQKVSFSVAGRAAQQRVEVLAAAPRSIHRWATHSWKCGTPGWGRSSLCSQEQHSSTYGQVCALSAWWRTPLLKSSFWLLVLIFKNNNSVLHGNWPVGSLKIWACDLLLPGSSTATGAREWTFLQGMGWKPNDVSSSFTQAGCFYGHPDNTAVVNVHIGHMKTAFMV